MFLFIFLAVPQHYTFWTAGFPTSIYKGKIIGTHLENNIYSNKGFEFVMIHTYLTYHNVYLKLALLLLIYDMK